MTYQHRYERAKTLLLNDKSICKDNRDIFTEFFEYEELYLRRKNRVVTLDEQSFRTVYDYISRLRAVNRWFENKPWRELSKADIQQVYDGVEDGKIVKRNGKRFENADTYYSRVLRGKPFKIAGKHAIMEEVFEIHCTRKLDDPRFIRETTFREIVDVLTKPEHVAFLWLAWDIGENVGALLQLKKQDFSREIDPNNQEAEYWVNLRREILKRSRTARTEATNYRETVKTLDQVLRNKNDDDLVFNFGHRMASKMLDRAVKITGAKCIPNGTKVRLKDLRSSMACDLATKGWTTDEVNRRLGHVPGSPEVRKYWNWVAVDNRKPKQKLRLNELASLRQEIELVKTREKLLQQRLRHVNEEVDSLKEIMEANNRLVHEQVAKMINVHGLKVEA